MGKLEGLLGLGIVSSTVVTGLSYWVAEAKGALMHGKEQVLPLFGLFGFCFGARSTHPDQKVDVKVGGVYAGVTAAVWGVSFGLGYLVERLTS